MDNSYLPPSGTIEMWVYNDGKGGAEDTEWDTLFSLVDPSGKAVFVAYLLWSGDIDPAVTAIDINGTGEYGDDKYPVYGNRVLFDRKVPAGRWAHIAFTWGRDGENDNRIYLNGSPASRYVTVGTGGNHPDVAKTGFLPGYVGPVQELWIGAEPTAHDSFTNGIIGEISIHDEVIRDFKIASRVPKIHSLSHDAFQVAGISGKLVTGDMVRFKMDADPGGKGSVDIEHVGSFPLAEDPENPGAYSGTLKIPPGVFVDSGMAIGSLAFEGGIESTPVESSSGTISIDSRTRFALSIDRTDLPADSASKARVKVKVTDANGVAVSGHRIKVTLATTDEYTGLVGGGSTRSRDPVEAAKELLAGAEVESRWRGETDSWGEAEFDFVSGFAAKTVILQAKDLTSGDVGVDYITSFKEASIDIALTPPISRAAARRGISYILKVEATRTELTADGRSRSAIRATLMDPNGAPVAGDPVSFTLSSPNGTLRTISGTTDSSGVATAEYTAGKKIGIVVVTATATLRNAQGNVSITLLADAPAKIYLKARPDSLPADGFSRADIEVKVTDVNDNPNENTKVEFRVAKGGGKVEYADRTTDSFGDASNRYTAGTAPGIATVLATVRSRIPTGTELEKARNVLFVPHTDEGEEIRVEKWLKRVGETARKGEPVLEYTVGRSRDILRLAAPYDCRVDFQYVEYWDEARTGDTLALITPVSIPGSDGQAPAPPALSPGRR